jgi:hypothetical protein
VEDLEQRARQLRQTALNKLIDNLLLEQAARAAGTDTDDYLRRNVEPELCTQSTFRAPFSFGLMSLGVD